MSAIQGEDVLAVVRTHPKILFKPAVLQVVLLAAHVLLAIYWPQNLGWAWIDQWGQLAVHGVIVIIEITYVILPIGRWWFSIFTLTSLRVTRRWGIVWKHSREIPLARITSVDVEQGLLDRMFGCGSLNFHDAATIPPAGYTPMTAPTHNGHMAGVRFHDIPRVDHFRALVDEARFKATDTAPQEHAP